MTTVVTQPSAPAGGDGIGLSIAVSTDQHDDDNNDDDNDNDNDSKSIASFLPPSVSSSPIPFQEEEQDEDVNTHHNIVVEEPPIISSIMRQQSRVQKGADEDERVTESIEQSDQSHVAALEDRVRDLEEKLSTLSLLLL